MTLFLICMLGAVGLSHLVVDGSIFASWRGYLRDKYSETKPWLVELITCYQCSSTWTGFFLGFIIQPITWNYYYSFMNMLGYLIITPCVMGFSASYLSMVAASFMNWLDAPLTVHFSKKNDQ